jgi:hypothetical protein
MLSVTADVLAEPLKLPLAPLPGAVNVTVTPETGFPLVSFTWAFNATAKTLLTVALCGVPAVAVMLAAGPAVFVKLNVAGVATPAVLAVAV